jgi:hypothetical protein
MQCSHCHTEISVTPHVFALGEDSDGAWQVSSCRCPVCHRLLVSLCTKEGSTYPAWPATLSRPRLSEDVPGEYATEYLAACQIIAFSPEASAALSRRLLHRLLAAHAGAGPGGLFQQIDKAARSPELPPYLKDALRSLAQIAKLAPDNEKSRRPEVLAPVEPGEAEWLLDVLQPLFELYFVQPARMQRRHDELEESIGLLSEPTALESAGAATAEAEAPSAGSAEPATTQPAS